MNLCASGEDIAFHFNPRFNEAGRTVIVANSYLGCRWGSEERPTQFPFAAKNKFEVICSIYTKVLVPEGP